MNSFNNNNFSDNSDFKGQGSSNGNFKNNDFRRKAFNNKITNNKTNNNDKTYNNDKSYNNDEAYNSNITYHSGHDDDKRNNETIIDELINSLFSQEYDLQQNLKKKQKQEDMYSNKKIEYEIIMDCSNKSDYIIYYRK